MCAASGHASLNYACPCPLARAHTRTQTRDRDRETRRVAHAQAGRALGANAPPSACVFRLFRACLTTRMGRGGLWSEVRAWARLQDFVCRGIRAEGHGSRGPDDVDEMGRLLPRERLGRDETRCYGRLEVTRLDAMKFDALRLDARPLGRGTADIPSCSFSGYGGQSDTRVRCRV